MKKQILFFCSVLIVFTTLIIALSGCKKDDGNNNTPPTDSIIKLGANTVWINDPTAQILQSVDSVKVIFNGNTEQLQGLAVGDIIVSGIVPNAPYGFLRKILAIQHNGSEYQFTTQEVPLTDAFEELHIDYTKNFSLNDTLSGKKQSLDFTVDLPNVIVYDADGNNNTTSDQIKINGSLAFSPSMTVDVDISFFHLDYARVEASFQTEIQNSITAGGSLASFSEEITVYQQPLTPFTIPGTPIVIVPILRVNVGANGSVNVSVSASYTNTNTVTAYVVYDNGAWDNGYYKTMENTYNFPGLTGNVNAKAYVEPGIDFSFFGSNWATGSVIAQGYAKFTGSVLPSPACELKAGVSAGIEAQLQIFGMTFAAASYPDIFDYSVVLYSCSNTGAPTADFNGSPTSFTVGLSSSFTDISTGNQTSWLWTFQGGNPPTSTEQNPLGINYSTVGVYDVTLTVTNANGSDTETKNDYITVTGHSPIAEFIASDTTPTVGQSVNFGDLSLYSPTSWSWSFQGGTPATSTQQHPQGIIYNTAGTYNVTLTATNIYGSDPEVKTGYIVVSQTGTAPIADFSASTTAITEGQTVNFTDLSANNPTSWQWTFAGGTPSSSTQQNPTGITYNTAGTYDVTLVATNGNGNDTEIKYDYVAVTGSGGNGCSGTTTVTDIDGNVYNVVEIGSQCWMQENLKTSKYRDGSSIPTGLNNTTWQNTTFGAYAIYNNDQANDITYGKLYNWYAVNDNRGLCPNGWHIPSDDEWKALEMFLGMSQSDADLIGNNRGTDEGGKLKSTSNLWLSPNTGATNNSGFTGLPGGLRINDGNYGNVSSQGAFWSTTENGNNVFGRALLWTYSQAARSSNLYRTFGYSCRCLKD